MQLWKAQMFGAESFAGLRVGCYGRSLFGMRVNATRLWMGWLIPIIHTEQEEFYIFPEVVEAITMLEAAWGCLGFGGRCGAAINVLHVPWHPQWTPYRGLTVPAILPVAS